MPSYFASGTNYPGFASAGTFGYVPGDEVASAATQGLNQWLLGKQKAEADRALAAGQQAAETQRAQIAADAATAGERGKQQRFSSIMGLLGLPQGGGGGAPGAGGMMPIGGGRVGIPTPVGGGGGFGGGFSGMLGGGGAYTAGGETTPPPRLSQYNPWSRGMETAAVNAGRAQNDKALASQMRNMQGGLASRGYAPGSAMERALGNQINAAGLSNRMNQERQTRDMYAGRFADQQNRIDQANNQQWAQLQDFDIRRRTPYLQNQASLFSSLLGAI